MNEDGWMMCVGVCWCVWSVCVWWPRQCFVVVFFCDLSPSKWCHFLTWRIWHVDFGHRNLDNFSQLEIGHCWDWCWSLILWVWLSVIECDWVCKLTFCNRCASRNASAKMCLCLCVCVFSKWSMFQNDQNLCFQPLWYLQLPFRFQFDSATENDHSIHVIMCAMQDCSQWWLWFDIQFTSV
jgi:hypothetical protein